MRKAGKLPIGKTFCRFFGVALTCTMLNACSPAAQQEKSNVSEAGFMDAALHQQTADLITLSTQRIRANGGFASLEGFDKNWIEETQHPVEECAQCKALGVSVSSEFGIRTDPTTGEQKKHAGVDIRAPKGTAVLALKGGIVLQSLYCNGYGLVIDIKQYDGNVARYAHLNKSGVFAGQRVETGMMIGEVGTSGRTTGAHLHLEVLSNGVPQNPMRYLHGVQQVVRCRQELETASRDD